MVSLSCKKRSTSAKTKQDQNVTLDADIASQMCRLDQSTGEASFPNCYCYPDIVPRLTITLRGIVSKFRQGAGIYQSLNCQNLAGEFSEAFGGWDLSFPGDFKADKVPGGKLMTQCGTCTYSVGNKVCYEANIKGKAYFYDV